MVRTCCKCHKVIKTLLDPTITVEIFHAENDTNEKFYVCQECHKSLLSYLTTNTEETEAHPINEDIAKGFEEFTKMMFRQGQAESEEQMSSISATQYGQIIEEVEKHVDQDTEQAENSKQ